MLFSHNPRVVLSILLALLVSRCIDIPIEEEINVREQQIWGKSQSLTDLVLKPVGKYNGLIVELKVESGSQAGAKFLYKV